MYKTFVFWKNLQSYYIEGQMSPTSKVHLISVFQTLLGTHL